MNIYHLTRNEVIHYEENSALIVIAVDEYAARERAADLAGREGVTPWLETADCVQIGIALPGFDNHGFACIDRLEA